MVLFYWSTHLETGHIVIDEQHRHLFDLANRLAIFVEGGDQDLSIEGVFAELADYARTHFRDEEHVLALSDLPEEAKQQHVLAHGSFLKKIETVAAQTDLGDANALSALHDFLVNWLVSHILKLDYRLARSIALREGRAQAGPLPSVQRALISALSETERRFRQLAEQAPTMIWFCGMTGVRNFVNRGWLSLAGLDNADDARDFDWMARIHPEDRAPYEALLHSLLRALEHPPIRSKQSDRKAAAQAPKSGAISHRPDESIGSDSTLESGEIEYRVCDASGQWRWILERIMPRHDGERCVGLAAAATDITAIRTHSETLERLVAERTRQLEVLARTDDLTGLPNRRAFEERFPAEVERARCYDRPLSLLYFDVDHFKVINDRFGHEAGDCVLIALAQGVRGALRSTDLVARIGGEEFVALLVETPLDEAWRLAEQVRRHVRSTAFACGADPTTISIGVTALEDDDTPAVMLRRADAAMLAAKRAGRNRVVIAPAGADARKAGCHAGC